MNVPRQYSDRLHAAAAVTGLAMLSVVTFVRELFLPGDTVRSHHFGDLSLYFVRIRRFGFAELADGNLALWNPHLFSGIPFVGAFQSAMLYPINLIYLVLPLAKAIHTDFAIHLFLMGAFMFGWTRSKGVSVPAAFLAGSILMLGQVTFARILAGQLTLVAAFAWAPLLFWAADKIIEKPSLRWTLVGIGAASMQVFAGYPQASFMTAITLGLYCAIQLATCQHRLRVIGALVAIATAPVFITAAQLWIGMYTMLQSVRAGGVSFDFATSFSFPPENLLTLLAPGFFGNSIDIPYWGRWIFWDTNAYIGATALVCGAIGVVYAPVRARVVIGGIALLLLVLSMGAYTPVYRIFYDWVPGLNRFRAPSKFLFLFVMMWCVFVAYGLDHLLKIRSVARGLWITPIVLGAIFSGAALAVWWVQDAERSFFTSLIARIESLPGWIGAASLIPGSPLLASNAAINLAGAGGTLLVVGAGVACARRSALAPLALVGFGILEVLLAGRSQSSTFRIQDLERPDMVAYYLAHPGDYRVLDAVGLNHAVEAGAYSTWGYDPVMLRRYVELTRAMQGAREDDIESVPRQHHRLMDMFRCRYITQSTGILGPIEIFEVGNPLPRALLVRDVVVRDAKAEILAVLMDASFDPRKTVVLEETLELECDPNETGGTIEILDMSTDRITVSVDTPTPAILLMTDAYNPGWRAISLDGSAEDSYRVLPANYAIRAIPLSAGQHRIRVEYAPWPFRIGKWVSVVSILIYVIAVIGTFKTSFRRHHTKNAT